MCLGITEEREGPEGPSSSLVYVVSQEDVTFYSLHKSTTKPMAGLWIITQPDCPARISTSGSLSSAAFYLESLSQDPTNDYSLLCAMTC